MSIFLIIIGIIGIIIVISYFNKKARQVAYERRQEEEKQKYEEFIQRLITEKDFSDDFINSAESELNFIEEQKPNSYDFIYKTDQVRADTYSAISRVNYYSEIFNRIRGKSSNNSRVNSLSKKCSELVKPLDDRLKHCHELKEAYNRGLYGK